MAVDLGDLYRLTYDHKSPGGDLVSADAATWTITQPDGTDATPIAATPVTTGRYQLDYQTALPGRHLARWLGTGTNPGAYVEAFDVRPPNPAYLISLADAKAQVNIAAAVTTHDEELRGYIESATWAVEDQLGRVVVRRAVTETVRGCRGARTVVLSRYPVVSLTSVTPLGGGTAYDVDDFDVDEHGIVTALTTRLFGDVRFGFIAGEAVVPANYGLAARIIVAHLWESQRGTSGGAPRFGGSDGGTAYTPSGFALPKRALELLGGRPPLVG